MRITISGVDAEFGAADLVKLHRLEPTVEVEFAVLFGTRTGREREPRYPPRNVVEAFAVFAKSTGVRCALHLCGRAARSAVSGEVPEDLITLAKAFQRVQINGCETELDRMVEFQKSIGVPVIAQVQSGFNGPELPRRSLHYLYDASGGRGISGLPSWPEARADAPCGYAGGIGPQNIKKAIRRAEALGGSWIDMETHVRTEDRLDKSKVRNVIRSAARVAEERKDADAASERRLRRRRTAGNEEKETPPARSGEGRTRKEA